MYIHCNLSVNAVDLYVCFKGRLAVMHVLQAVCFPQSFTSIYTLGLPQVLEACLSTGAMRNTRVPSLPKSPLSPDKRVARLQAEEAGSATSRGSSHFGGHQFWGALRNASLESQVTPAHPCMLQHMQAVNN